MKTALAVTVVLGAALAFSMREAVAATPIMWAALLVPHAALAALGILRMYRDGTLRDKFRIRPGDLTIGFLLGGVLIAGGWGVRQLLMGNGSPRVVWLYRVAFQVGTLRPSPTFVVLL